MNFPNEIFTKILGYCDDRIEKRQKNRLALILEDLVDRVECEWQAYLLYYGETVEVEKMLENDWPEYSDVTITWWSCGDADGKDSLIPLIN